MFGCFFAGAVACLGMSGTYHTIGNHSHEVAVWGNKLDYLGIVGLIWGSFVPVIWYAFESETALMRGYWSMVSEIVLREDAGFFSRSGCGTGIGICSNQGRLRL